MLQFFMLQAAAFHGIFVATLSLNIVFHGDKNQTNASS